MHLYSDSLGVRNIPNFLMAQTPQGLRRKMRSNNIFHGGYVQYFDICQTKDGKWIAWYIISLKEVINEDEAAIDGN